MPLMLPIRGGGGGAPVRPEAKYHHRAVVVPPAGGLGGMASQHQALTASSGHTSPQAPGAMLGTVKYSASVECLHVSSSFGSSANESRTFSEWSHGERSSLNQVDGHNSTPSLFAPGTSSYRLSPPRTSPLSASPPAGGAILGPTSDHGRGQRPAAIRSNSAQGRSKSPIAARWATPSTAPSVDECIEVVIRPSNRVGPHRSDLPVERLRQRSTASMDRPTPPQRRLNEIASPPRNVCSPLPAGRRAHPHAWTSHTSSSSVAPAKPPAHAYAGELGPRSGTGNNSPPPPPTACTRSIEVPAWAMPHSQGGVQTRSAAPRGEQASVPPINRDDASTTAHPAESSLTAAPGVPQSSSFLAATRFAAKMPPLWSQGISDSSNHEHVRSAPRLLSGKGLICPALQPVSETNSTTLRRGMHYPASQPHSETYKGEPCHSALLGCDTSPSSDLHGIACMSQLGRTPSAPDSLLSGAGGLDLSASLLHPSLTFSTSSSSNHTMRPCDGSGIIKASAPLSPASASAPPAAIAAPAARKQGCELDASVPQLAMCAEHDGAGRRTPELALCTENDTPVRRTPDRALCPEHEPSGRQASGRVPENSQVSCPHREDEPPGRRTPEVARPVDSDRPAAQPMSPCRRKPSEAAGDENMPPPPSQAPKPANIGRPAAQSMSPCRRNAAESVGDENLPPTPSQDGKEGHGAILGGRSERIASERIAKMCSYWEGRVSGRERANHPGSARADGLGGSLRECNQRNSGANILRERHSEARRDSGSSANARTGAKGARSVSASLARHAGAESRRCSRRAARQQKLTDDLWALMQVVCPSEAEGALRSSSSESEPLAEETGSRREEEDDWIRLVERENKVLNKHLRQYTRLFTQFLLKRSASCGPVLCPGCATALACPRCSRNGSTVIQVEGPNRGISTGFGAVVDTAEPKMIGGLTTLPDEASVSALRHTADLGDRGTGVFGDDNAMPTSPTSPPTVQEEEPAGEPDSGLLST